MPRDATMRRLAGIAPDQWGLVTRQQAEGAGIPRRTLDRLAAPGSVLERVALGVYLVAGSPIPDHLELRAAWLQLAPGVPVWERSADEGVVSHRSAAAIYGLGHFPADRHEFTMPARRQVRRPDVRVHVRHLNEHEWIRLEGLLVTRPSRIVSDLLWDDDDPEGIARIAMEAIRDIKDDAGTFAAELGPHAARLGLRKNNGTEVLRWLLDIAGDREVARWAMESVDPQTSFDLQPRSVGSP